MKTGTEILMLVDEATTRLSELNRYVFELEHKLEHEKQWSAIWKNLYFQTLEQNKKSGLP